MWVKFPPLYTLQRALSARKMRRYAGKVLFPVYSVSISSVVSVSVLKLSNKILLKKCRKKKLHQSEYRSEEYSDLGLTLFSSFVRNWGKAAEIARNVCAFLRLDFVFVFIYARYWVVLFSSDLLCFSIILCCTLYNVHHHLWTLFPLCFHGFFQIGVLCHLLEIFAKLNCYLELSWVFSKLGLVSVTCRKYIFFDMPRVFSQSGSVLGYITVRCNHIM